MTDTVNLNDLLDNEQTAALLGIKPNTLEIWRHKGKGPRFCKLGRAKQAPVRYQRAEVAGWLEQQSFAAPAPTARPPTPPPNTVTCGRLAQALEALRLSGASPTPKSQP